MWHVSEKGERWHGTAFHYGFLYYRFLLLKSSWLRRGEWKKIKNKGKTRKKTPIQSRFLNSPALLSSQERPLASAFLPESNLYHPNSGCAEHKAAIALLLKAVTIALETSCGTEGFWPKPLSYKFCIQEFSFTFLTDFRFMMTFS